MSTDYMADLSSVLNASGLTTETVKQKTKPTGKSELDMTDYLQLMVAMFQNQSIDDTADVGELMNNMVQMSVVEAITSISSLIEQSTSLNYAAGLVGKEVTVGEYVGGKLVEHVGTVTGTGTLDGQQVIFLGEDCYLMSSVMAVGRLPSNAEGALEAVAESLKPAAETQKSEETLAAEAAAAAAQSAAAAARAAAEAVSQAAGIASGTQQPVTEIGGIPESATTGETQEPEPTGTTEPDPTPVITEPEPESPAEQAEQTLEEQGSEAAAEQAAE